jgi:hypothetical protein
MSTKEQLLVAEHELFLFKQALTNAKAIEQTYLKFGPIFDELFEKIQLVERKITQVEAKVDNHQNMIVKALQDKYRNGTA